VNEDLITRAFLNRFLNNFSGAANAVSADDPGFDPADSDEWFEFHIDSTRRHRRCRDCTLRIYVNCTFTICVKSPEANVYDAPDYADELRTLFEYVCFPVLDESGSEVGVVDTREIRLTDGSSANEADLGETGSVYICQLRACATEF
jgi:hypothetical protein